MTEKPDTSYVLSGSDITLITIGCIVHSISLAVHICVYKIRFYRPLRSKYVGITITASLGATVAFSMTTLVGFLGNKLPVSQFFCWFWYQLLVNCGTYVFMCALCAKHYRAYREYVNGTQQLYSASLHIFLLLLPWIFLNLSVMLGDTYTQGSQAACMVIVPVQNYTGIGYLIFLSLLMIMFTLLIKSKNKIYEYPNLRDSVFDCAGVIVICTARVVAEVLRIMAYTESAHRVNWIVNLIVIPNLMYWNVVLKPLYKFFQKDERYTQEFEFRYGFKTPISKLFPGQSFFTDYNTVRSQSKMDNNTSMQIVPAENISEIELLSKYVMSGDLVSIKALLFRSTLAILNETDLEGTTPLHRSVRCNFTEICSFLLNMGADPDSVEKDGITPLHIAVSLNNTRIVQMLLRDYKANPNAMTESQGKTPLHVAVKNESVECLKLLLQHNADSNIKGNIPELESLTDVKIYLRRIGSYSVYKSPLFLACELGLHKFIVLMSQSSKGIDLDRAGTQGLKCIHVAALVANKKVLETLTNLGADLWQVNKRQERNIFHYVCASGCLPLFLLVLKAMLSNAPPESCKHEMTEVSRDILNRSSTARSLSNSSTSSSSSGWGCGYSMDDAALAKAIDAQNIQEPAKVVTISEAILFYINSRDFIKHRTPLHYAVLKGNADLVYLLLCLGSRISRDNKRYDEDDEGGSEFGIDCPSRGLTPKEYAEALLTQNKGNPTWKSIERAFKRAESFLDCWAVSASLNTISNTVEDRLNACLKFQPEGD